MDNWQDMKAYLEEVKIRFALMGGDDEITEYIDDTLADFLYKKHQCPVCDFEYDMMIEWKEDEK